MTSTPSLRIDTAIQPTSSLRFLLYGGLGSIMGLLAWLAPLFLWQYVFLLIVVTVVTVYLAFSRPIPLHFSQPPLSHRLDKHWQLLIRTSRGDELWQAQLVAVHGCRWAVSLEFIIVEPYRRPLAITIFRDQVSVNQWRELGVLANISTNKT
ncbi:hypothetical protein [Psychrobacter alimentarius]|uniref:hypothetical protein n=1 Tax=Psychrobacter alimentarius TaxID=261164 RepID=UPI001919AB34|nr:hypothetical protein [Psychrobacter alimentarius]